MTALYRLIPVALLLGCSSLPGASPNPSTDLAIMTVPAPDLPRPDAGPVVDAALGDSGNSGDLTLARRWVQESLPMPPGVNLFSVHGTGPNDIFVVGEQGTILHSDGNAWSRQLSGTTERLLQVFALSSTNIYAVGDHAVVHSSDGRTWTLLRQDGVGAPQLNGVFANRADDVYVVGDRGTLLHSTDGQNFSALDSKTMTSLHRAIGTTGSGEILISADLNLQRGAANQPFVTVNVGSTEACMSLWGSAAGPLFIAADRGVILFSPDGRSFRSQLSGALFRLQDVWGLTPTDVYVVGDNGTLLHTRDGQTWEAQATSTVQNLRGVWGSDPSNIYVVGYQSTLLRLR